MASSGGWLVFSFIVLLVVVEFKTSSSSKCERGLGNCDELVISSDSEKHEDLRSRGCGRFACIGRKRESKESLKATTTTDPENERKTIEEIIDDIFQKRLAEKRQEVAVPPPPPPPCYRFACGKKRSFKGVVPAARESDEMASKRKLSPRFGCWRFGGCKKTIHGISSPTFKKKESMMNQEDSKSDCFRFGCKKRALGGVESHGSLIAPDEETQESLPLDQDDMSRPGCWRFGCKRSEQLRKKLNKIIDTKRFIEKSNNHFDSKKRETER